MRYNLKLRAIPNSEHLEVLRSNSMGDSFLGRISPENAQIWLSDLKKEKPEAPDDLDRVDKFFARWTMGAKEISKIHECKDSSTTHIRTYLCRNKKREEFYLLKVRTDKPAYQVESVPFEKDSVLEELTKCEPAGAGQPDNPPVKP
jgi:hypothetical protein